MIGNGDGKQTNEIWLFITLKLQFVTKKVQTAENHI